MKIALYIAFQNKSSIDCSKEIVDLISDNNQLVVDSKLKNEIDKNKSSNLIFFDSNESIDPDIDFVLAVGGDGTILRSITYVKDSDIWEKDNELLHILKGIKALSSKQRSLISKWKKVNKNWNTDENLQSRLTNLVCNSMKHIESDEKETGKIIRSISKNVYLDNDTKRLYA